MCHYSYKTNRYLIYNEAVHYILCDILIGILIILIYNTV